jgi:hypothetical protein
MSFGYLLTVFFAFAIYSVMRSKGQGNIFDKHQQMDFDVLLRYGSFHTGYPFTLLPYLCVSESSYKVFGFDLKNL